MTQMTMVTTHVPPLLARQTGCLPNFRGPPAVITAKLATPTKTLTILIETTNVKQLGVAPPVTARQAKLYTRAKQLKTAPTDEAVSDLWLLAPSTNLKFHMQMLEA